MTSQFIEDCRYIGRSLGKPDPKELRRQKVACHLDPQADALFFRTDRMLIGVGTKDLSLVLIKLDNNNPVIVLAHDGSHIHYHGDAGYLIPDVSSAVAHLGKFGREAFAV